MRQKLRNDNEEPNDVVAATESLLPRMAMLRTESEDPKFPTPRIAKAEPNRVLP